MMWASIDAGKHSQCKIAINPRPARQRARNLKGRASGNLLRNFRASNGVKLIRQSDKRRVIAPASAFNCRAHGQMTTFPAMRNKPRRAIWRGLFAGDSQRFLRQRGVVVWRLIIHSAKTFISVLWLKPDECGLQDDLSA